MKYIETVGNYKIYEASKEECKKGYMGMPWEYPCFCVFYKDETEITFKTSESDFETLEESKKWCEKY